jgi:proteasome activator subunit 3 (PA28 gamma)
LRIFEIIENRERHQIKKENYPKMSKSSESSKEIDSFKEKVKKDAEELILTKFPKKILDLDVLLNGEKFSPNLDLTRVDINIPVPESPTGENANTSGEGLPTKRRQTLKQSTDEIENDLEDEMSLSNKPFLFPMGVVESNKNLMELIDVLKPQMLELIEDIILLKLGISLMIPQIGKEIQN